jgi:putative ABC transport system permease protein
LFRRKGRLLLTLLALSAAGVAFLLVMSLLSSVNLTLDRELARTGYTVKLGFASEQPVARVEAVTRQMTGAFELWYRSPVALAFNGKALRYVGGLGAQAVGLPPPSQFYQPKIVAGRWLNADDAQQNVLLLNAETAELNGLKVGDNLSLAAPGQAAADWRVIGLYRWIAGGGYTVEAIYTPLAALRSASGRPELASQVLVATTRPDTQAEETAYAEQLQTAFEQAGIKLDFYSSTARLEQRRQLASQFRPVISMLFGLASMMACVGGIGLSGALSISVMQRRREIGVLRAIGAPSRAIFGLFLWEGILQAMMAWAFSIPLAFILAKPVAEQLGITMLHVALDYQFNWLAVWVWLAVVILIAIVAAYAPARGATRVTVREATAG